LRKLVTPTILCMTALGTSSGLPFLLVFSTLSVWLREAGVSRPDISFLSYLTLTFSLKFLWAPLVDTLSPPWLSDRLGPRRAWMLLAQLAVILGVVGMAGCSPATGLMPLAVFALLTSFASATQDIVIDAWRIEAATIDQQGIMTAAYQLGYRIGLIIAGAGALYIAEFRSWGVAYICMAIVMITGIVACLLAKPTTAQTTPWQGFATLFAPVTSLVRRLDGPLALGLLVVASYRLSEVVAGVMVNPLYIDAGYSKVAIANFSKIYGVGIALVGAIGGGMALARLGMRLPLIFGAAAAAGSNLMFAWLASSSPRDEVLFAAISIDNFSAGFPGTILIAYMSSLVSRQYVAADFALLSSLFTLPGRLLGGLSGGLVDAVGYANFFVYMALIGIPVCLLCVAAPISSDEEAAG
jgi:MFS transporter, PAT family, beta-lactamase induction signal transducer AmpG